MRKLRGVVLLLVLILLLVLNSDSQGIIKDDFKINDDSLKLDQDMPDIDVDDLGNFVIVWQDPRNNGTDIFAQRFNLSGEVLGDNFMVNNEISGYQKYPSVACEASGNFTVVWQDSRDGNRDIYAQRFNFSGDTLDSNFKINDDPGTKPQIEPEVNFSNKIVAVWEDERYDSGDIFAQLLDPSGQPEDTNFKINDDSFDFIQLRADISSDFNGNFVVVWQDKREGNYDIFAQRFDSSGSFLNNNLKVNDDIGNSLQNFPKADSDSMGNFVVVWQDKRNGDEDVYAQIFNDKGEKIGKNFRVNDDVGNSYQGHPDVTVNKEGNFILVWVDKRNDDRDIYAQRYDSNFNPLEHNFRVNSDTESAEQTEPKVATNGKNIYFTWVDNRNGDSDIYAKVVDWNFTEIEEIEVNNKFSTFFLSHNFPNPFNAVTNIRFTVNGELKNENRPPYTTLMIYNLRGQLVRTLVNEYLKPGIYTAVWDGRNNKGSEVASGIYFYRLKMDDYTKTRKMLLLK